MGLNQHQPGKPTSFPGILVSDGSSHNPEVDFLLLSDRSENMSESSAHGSGITAF